MSKASELKKHDKKELEKKIEELRKKQRELRFGKARGELKNPMEKRQVKREIARILTVLREKS
ncbi:50S ribosomal protein L29 [candidate division WOR-1 bacterium RIFOXYA12_FULL_43_27]|uniref:Large ribosomal subunit protein uL29 n=1 Tax=candidate division WOR-1 bacterium RIFOXYC2_FULL_46_14 TaxID=1802587 RepID=A0A1F4U5Q1_UNCSA|nr:MAG: 50S ribosomal protein L29 [candidate division WOR-1 bacterium RIFOXYA12_FULL_43_27]OGC20439.1 MAG: 50S ribosomal protein L29 [candidate division WOR-1 bacterium RIFOXYB2_FULL_46_45]OGC31824.1 MAG: 50S ribosomal protein L29 [candidate division WOR-1 bacterium RIFOXYA2_FULL_46_56]OGC40284.1 MAG: 50S ribosomal protein L29 [candidate division WOR-1 bacterium RIFOXYC2_FULL_46_14]